MKFLIVAIFALAAVTHAWNVHLEDVIHLEETTAYNYINKIGIPLAEKIRKAEEAAINNPSRIIGGSLAALGQFPYQAALLVNTASGALSLGGAVLVSPTRVLTAAHNWNDGVSQGLGVTVVLGTNTVFTGGTMINGTDVIVHENWTPALIRNDIAMVQLSEAVLFSNFIAPIALPSGSQLEEDFVGDIAVATGYGKISDFGGAPNPLNYVNLPVISNEECQASFAAGFVHESNVCISGAEGNICTGDSGGPLAVTRNDAPLLIGITSFGSSRGCEARQPSAFARITYYRDWIDRQM